MRAESLSLAESQSLQDRYVSLRDREARRHSFGVFSASFLRFFCILSASFLRPSCILPATRTSKAISRRKEADHNETSLAQEPSSLHLCPT
jgi:hypothetical protein